MWWNWDWVIIILASNDTLYAYMRRLVMKEGNIYVCFLCSEGVDFPLDTVQPRKKMGELEVIIFNLCGM